MPPPHLPLIHLRTFRSITVPTPLIHLRTFRSITVPTPLPNPYNHAPNLSTPGASPRAALLRRATTTPLRTGALAIKHGMTAIYDPLTARRTPATVLQLDRVRIIGHKRARPHGYWAVQVGAGFRAPHTLSRPEAGLFAARAVPAPRHQAEFRVRGASGLPPVGRVVTAALFRAGDFVDARAVTRGMGFAGGMKRWGWGGQPASHGTSLTHRAMGSAGGGQGSGSRVHPGKRMAGRMGGERHTVQSLRVLRVDVEAGIVVVAGPVPGPRRGVVRLQDAIKKPWPEVDPCLGLVEDEVAVAAAEGGGAAARPVGDAATASAAAKRA